MFGFFLNYRNIKQWLEYEQFCAYSFRNVCIEDLLTISLVKVYERLIHATIRQ
jgi:hypothetical protein